MKRISIFLIALVLLALPAAAQTNENAKDSDAITDIAQKWQAAWNKGDMTMLAALVAEDVDFVNVAGIRAKSQKEFKQFHAQRFEMQFKESVWTTKTADVKFIKSDVAIAHVEWGIKGDKDPDGTPRPPREGIFTWVVQKQTGKWLIIAAQNTNLRESIPNLLQKAESASERRKEMAALYKKFTDKYNGTVEQKKTAIEAAKEFVKRFGNDKDNEDDIKEIIKYFERAIPALEKMVARQQNCDCSCP